MDGAIAALAGAAIGAVASIGATWVQQRHQTRRERLKIATDLALADFNHTVDRLKGQPGGGPLLPIASYVAYHLDALDALAAGRFDADEVARIEERQRKLLEALPLRFQTDAPAGGGRRPY